MYFCHPNGSRVNGSQASEGSQPNDGLDGHWNRPSPTNGVAEEESDEAVAEEESDGLHGPETVEEKQCLKKRPSPTKVAPEGEFDGLQ